MFSLSLELKRKLLIFILQSQVFITVFYPFVKTFQALRGLQWVI